MHCHLYLRKGSVFIPTSGIVHKGLHHDIEPVAVVPASNADAIRQALHATIARGNPPTPHYPRGLLSAARRSKICRRKKLGSFRTRRVAALERQRNNGVYQIVGRRKHPDGWAQDPEQKIEFPPGSTVDQVIDRMIAILQDAARGSSKT